MSFNAPSKSDSTQTKPVNEPKIVVDCPGISVSSDSNAKSVICDNESSKVTEHHQTLTVIPKGVSNKVSPSPETSKSNATLSLDKTSDRGLGRKKSFQIFQKAATKVTLVSRLSKPVEKEERHVSLKSVAKRVNRQIKAKSLIEKWTEMTSLSQFAKDKDHLKFIRDTAEESSTEIPDQIMGNMRKEVFNILQDTMKQYKVELGTNHTCTTEMDTAIQSLQEDIYNTVPVQERKTGNYLAGFPLFNE